MYTTNFTKRAGKYFTPSGIEISSDLLAANSHGFTPTGGWIKTHIRLDAPLIEVQQFIVRIKGVRRFRFKTYEVQVTDQHRRYAAAETLLNKLEVKNVVGIEFID